MFSLPGNLWMLLDRETLGQDFEYPALCRKLYNIPPSWTRFSGSLFQNMHFKPTKFALLIKAREVTRSVNALLTITKCFVENQLIQLVSISLNNYEFIFSKSWSFHAAISAICFSTFQTFYFCTHKSFQNELFKYGVQPWQEKIVVTLLPLYDKI